MVKKNLEHVVFEESYLLGWAVRPDEVLLFLQVLLTPEHPSYRPYDERTEFGCYRLGVLRFSGVTSTTGVAGQRLPIRPPGAAEFTDIDEINEVVFSENSVRIEGDETTMHVACAAVRLDVLTRGSKDAFAHLQKKPNRNRIPESTRIPE